MRLGGLKGYPARLSPFWLLETHPTSPGAYKPKEFRYGYVQHRIGSKGAISMAAASTTWYASVVHLFWNWVRVLAVA